MTVTDQQTICIKHARGFLRAAGIMTWTPGWKHSTVSSEQHPENVSTSHAEVLKNSASTPEKVKAFISVDEVLLAVSPDNRDILADLCCHCALVGYGYAADKKEAACYLLKSLYYAERLMYQNPGFRQSINAGEP